MATAYLSSRGLATQAAKARTGYTSDYCEFTVPAAGFIINDTVKLIKIPLMARILRMVISLPILDTGGTACRVSVGDSAGAGTYMTAASNGTGYSAAVDLVFPSAMTGVVQGVLGVRYAADDYVIMKITTAATTAAVTGTIRAWVDYQMDGGTQAGI